MTTDELTPTENRITHGLDQLIRSAAAWLTATDLPTDGRTRAAIGRAIGGGVATWFVGGMAYELGPIAWGSAGALTALSVWVAGAPADPETDDPDDDQDAEQLLDADVFAELVNDVAHGANVHLTAIRQQLIEETERDWDVLALCRAAGIPTKPVRVPGADPAVTTGIHRLDLPPLPSPDRGAPVGVVAAGQYDNNNTNTPTIEQIGEGGRLIKTGPSIGQEASR